jgi:hypothetical protein
MRMNRVEITALHDMVTLNENLCAALGSIVANTAGVVHRWRNPEKACQRVHEIAVDALRGKFDQAIEHRAVVMRRTAAHDALERKAGKGHGRVAVPKTKIRRYSVPAGARELAAAVDTAES